MKNWKIVKTIEKVDILLFQKIFNWHGRRSLDRVMAFFSYIGNGYLYPIVGVFVTLVDSAATKMLFPVALTSFAIDLSVYGVVKLKFRRTRPCNRIPGVKNLTKMQDRFSFPSGHTAAAFLMATVLRFFYPHLTVPLYLSSSAIGVSRIYNGLHFPSDVLFGGLLGFLSARVSLLLFF
jgi:undecaprenyl-diphosphatase